MSQNSKKYNKTLLACYLGFITQAITANFTPLLFLMFNKNYDVSLGKIALIPAVFFMIVPRSRSVRRWNNLFMMNLSRWVCG